MEETTKSLDQFMTKMHDYKPYTIQEAYQALIAEYHLTLSGIEDYFKQADKNSFKINR